jgi:hypothetical protein
MVPMLVKQNMVSSVGTEFLRLKTCRATLDLMLEAQRDCLPSCCGFLDATSSHLEVPAFNNVSGILDASSVANCVAPLAVFGTISLPSKFALEHSTLVASTHGDIGMTMLKYVPWPKLPARCFKFGVAFLAWIANGKKHSNTLHGRSENIIMPVVGALNGWVAQTTPILTLHDPDCALLGLNRFATVIQFVDIAIGGKTTTLLVCAMLPDHVSCLMRMPHSLRRPFCLPQCTQVICLQSVLKIGPLVKTRRAPRETIAGWIFLHVSDSFDLVAGLDVELMVAVAGECGYVLSLGRTELVATMSWSWNNRKDDWRNNKNSDRGAGGDYRNYGGASSSGGNPGGGRDVDAERRRAWSQYYGQKDRADQLEMRLKDIEDEKAAARAAAEEEKRQKNLVDNIQKSVAAAVGSLGLPLLAGTGSAPGAPAAATPTDRRDDQKQDQKHDKPARKSPPRSATRMLLRELTRKASNESSGGEELDRSALANIKRRLARWLPRRGADGKRSDVLKTQNKHRRKSSDCVPPVPSSGKRGRHELRDDPIDDSENDDSDGSDDQDDELRSDSRSPKRKRPRGRTTSTRGLSRRGDRYHRRGRVADRRSSGVHGGRSTSSSAAVLGDGARVRADGASPLCPAVRSQRTALAGPRALQVGQKGMVAAAARGGRATTPPVAAKRAGFQPAFDVHGSGPALRGPLVAKRPSGATTATPTPRPLPTPRLPEAAVDGNDEDLDADASDIEGLEGEESDVVIDDEEQEDFEGFDSLAWYDFFREVGEVLIDGFVDDHYPCFKEVTDQTSFDVAVDELSDATTRAKIDQLLTDCSVQSTGTKRAKVTALMMWKSGH